jgi:hypothetical protein
VKRLRLTTLLLLLLNGVLGVSVVVLWTRGEKRVTEPARLSVPPLALPDMTALSSVPMPSVDIAGIREQAVFYASRAFYRPPAAPTQVPAPEYDISGTLRLADGKRIAFVKRKADQSSRTLHVGDDLEGWHVQLIDADRIVLDRNEQSAELRSGAAGVGTAGLIRGPGAPRALQTGIRVLGATGPGALPLPALGAARDARLFRPPPPAGK